MDSFLKTKNRIKHIYIFIIGPFLILHIYNLHINTYITSYIYFINLS